MIVEIAAGMLSKLLASEKQEGEGAAPEVSLGGILSWAILPGPSSDGILGSVDLGCIKENTFGDFESYPG